MTEKIEKMIEAMMTDEMRQRLAHLYMRARVNMESTPFDSFTRINHLYMRARVNMGGCSKSVL
jgi:hypothetical protein